MEKIYKIVNSENSDIYYGSTTKRYLSARFQDHKEKYKLFKAGKFTNQSIFKIFDDVGVDNCKIVLVQLYPCNSRDELTAKETEYICENKCVNIMHGNGSRLNRKNLLQNTDEKTAQQRALRYRQKNDKTVKAKKNEKHSCGCGEIGRVHV